jgi:hypothetical protein
MHGTLQRVEEEEEKGGGGVEVVEVVEGESVNKGT